MGGRSAGLWLGGLWGLQAELGAGSTGKSGGYYFEVPCCKHHEYVGCVLLKMNSVGSLCGDMWMNICG